MKRAFLAAVVACLIAVGVASAAGPSLLYPSTIHKTAPATFKVQFVTTKGPFVITVTRSWAPKGADRFYSLVYYHFYDNQPIFRVLPAYIAQWGISMTPAIAKAWRYAVIPDEPAKQPNTRGMVDFAISGPNTRTTQIFVNLGDNSHTFGWKFVPFGRVTTGLGAVFHLLYHGYGETPESNQASMIKYGAWWVRKFFPHLDWIKTARIIP